MTGLSLEASYSGCISSYGLDILNVSIIFEGPLAFIIVSFEHILLDQDLKNNFRGFPLVDVFVFAK